MATTATAPKKKPEPSVTARANDALAAAKTGPEPLKPIRYTLTFLGGSLKDGLNDMAGYGRKGLWVGLGLGMIAAVAMSALLPVMIGAAIGFALGAVGGGTYGLATGGFKAVGRVHRGEIYAEDLIKRKKVQEVRPDSRADYRAAYNEQQRRNSYITQQVLERNNEFREDFNERQRGDNYWQSFVNNSSNAERERGA